MYVLIDMNQCAITHKHTDREVLAALGWIECLNAAKVLPLGNPRLFYDALTPVELMRIFKCATGEDVKAYGNQLAGIVHDLAKRMDDSDVIAAEVYAQKAYVLPADNSAYRYLKGSAKPEHKPTLYPAPSLKVARDPAAEATAAASYAAYAPAPLPPPPPAGLPAVPKGVAAPREPRAPSEPRKGGVKDIIFSVADELWEQAGKPTDLSVVLKLRKEIMQVLEDRHQVKKTTASTSLGDWQKQRI